MTKWSKAHRTKFMRTVNRKRVNAAKNAIKTIAIEAEARGQAHAKKAVLAGEYVGQQAEQAIDVHKIEDRAFRRGLFTGLQMVVDLLIRELR